MLHRPWCAVLALTTGCWLVESGPEPSYNRVVLSDAPVAYWRLSEDRAETAVDASGHNNDAGYDSTVTLGRPGAIANDANTAVLLADTKITPPLGFVWSGDLTIEAWIAPHASGVQESILIWESYNVRGFRFGWQANYAPLFWTMQSGGSDEIASSLVMTPDAWNHVVLTKVATTIAIYVDGTLGVSATAADYVPASPDDTERCWGSCEGIPTNADFDELAIYDHALSPEQIARHYGGGAR